MLSVSSSIRIFMARQPVDFRKAHDGLLAIVRDEFGDDPFDGSVFVFLNRKRDRVKVLHWDSDGFWLHYKRLERGTFQLQLEESGKRAQISRPQLVMLLEGIDLKRSRIREAFPQPKRYAQREHGEGTTDMRASG
jgi:transposase